VILPRCDSRPVPQGVALARPSFRQNLPKARPSDRFVSLGYSPDRLCPHFGVEAIALKKSVSCQVILASRKSKGESREYLPSLFLPNRDFIDLQEGTSAAAPKNHGGRKSLR